MSDLTKAVRQFRHNYEDGFVIGYDCEIVDKEVDRLTAQIAEVTAQRDGLVATLEHIAEYWNRDTSESAMADALWHIVEECDTTLAQLRAPREST